MDIGTLARYATEPERRVLAAILQRAQAMAAVVVTLREGAGARRYVVAREDEEDLRPLAGLAGAQLAAALGSGRYPGAFGGQWLRGSGRVDEQHRTLPLAGVVAVHEVDRARIWGSGTSSAAGRPRRAGSTAAGSAS